MLRKLFPQILLILALLTFPSLTLGSTFSDVPSTNSDYLSIETLYSLGIISGYPDGTFRPNQSVNRAEALKMILNSAKVSPQNGLFETGFKDVPLDSWFSKYVFFAIANKIVNGNPDGTFAPARQVNKAEFLKMLLKTFAIDLSQYQNPSQELSSDTKIGDWYMPYLNYAKTTGLIYPNLQNQLEPGKYLTRAECAEIIYKMVLLYFGGETQKLLDMTEAKLIDALVKLNNNDLTGSIDEANQALFYSSEALKNEPKLSITIAANQISQAFESLIQAYQAKLQKNQTNLQNYRQTALLEAQKAVASDVSVKPLSDKIIELANQL